MSHSIRHKVGIQASPSAIYQALTSNEGLAKWWTHEVSGAGPVGSIITFKFNDINLTFKVSSLKKDQQIIWAHQGDMPEAWKGTHIWFDIKPGEGQCFVHFQHSNWQAADDFFAHCNTKWAVFLLSLKDYLETGQGQAFPNDVPIDHS